MPLLDWSEYFYSSFQDENRGGISDRADDECDVFHTFFGIAGLSLLGVEDLQAINPVFALPEEIVAKVVNRPSSSVIQKASRG